jgi:two-component system chemotaxis sensor kinase CheA
MRRLGDGERFDVIVSDIEMPVVNGFEFAEMLRRDPRFRTTPIIALSALCTPASIERGRQSGFDDYVAKFDRPGLIATLKDLTSSNLGIAA